MGGNPSTCRGRRGLWLLTGAVGALAVTSAARDARANLIITPTWDSSVTSLPNAAQVQAAVNYAIGQYEQRFPTPTRTVNVQMNVVAASGTSTFGHSNYYLNSYSYSAIQAALIAANPADAAGVSSADPVTGSHSWWVTTAQAKALGLRTNSTTNTDGTFTFGAGNNFNYDATNRAIPVNTISSASPTCGDSGPRARAGRELRGRCRGLHRLRSVPLFRREHAGLDQRWRRLFFDGRRDD